MKATITYCFPCRYQAEALTAADTLLTTGVQSVELIKGTNGIFDIAIDDAVEYSKPIGAAFPGYDELITLVREAKSHVI